MPDFETVSPYYLSLTTLERFQVAHCFPYVLPEFHDPVCDALYFILSLEFYGQVFCKSQTIPYSSCLLSNLTWFSFLVAFFHITSVCLFHSWLL